MGVHPGWREPSPHDCSGWTSCIVDDHPAVRAGLRGLVEDEDGLRVAATRGHGARGLRGDRRHAARASRWSTSTCPTTTACRCACARARCRTPPRVIIYSAFADAGLAVRGRDRRRRGRAAQGHRAARCCSTRCATALRPPLDAARAAGGRASAWTPDDLADPRHARPRGRRRARSRPRSGSSPSGSSARRGRCCRAVLAPDSGREAQPARGRGDRSGRRLRQCGRMPTRDQILEALKVVIDPELHRKIVELGMVRAIDDLRAGGRERHGLADDPRLPDQRPFPDRRRQGGERASKASPPSASASTSSPTRRSGPAEDARPPRRAARGRARPGRERRLHRLRQGRRRQVHADRQPRRRAAGRGQDGRRARRRRLGLLDPAHARPRRPAPEGLGREEDPPARGARPEGHLDRLLPQGGRGGRVARPDAPQGAHAVPRGRRVGRARLPADRPAAGHRRRLDDAQPSCCRRRRS